jgi:hypothetical protein
MTHTAYCIVTIDTRTGGPTEVGIYSEACPTHDLLYEIRLPAMTMKGASYASAARQLVECLRDSDGATRWLFDRLSESDRRMALTGRP